MRSKAIIFYDEGALLPPRGQAPQGIFEQARISSINTKRSRASKPEKFNEKKQTDHQHKRGLGS
jgi:hypothetical protein